MILKQISVVICLKISILKSICDIKLQISNKTKKVGKAKLNHISPTVSIQQEAKANNHTLTLSLCCIIIIRLIQSPGPLT